jgi:hypothetical protein
MNSNLPRREVRYINLLSVGKISLSARIAIKHAGEHICCIFVLFRPRHGIVVSTLNRVGLYPVLSWFSWLVLDSFAFLWLVWESSRATS